MISAAKPNAAVCRHSVGRYSGAERFAQVTVLMSTYQGERFVTQQVLSILDQLPPTGALIIRDDGSTDNTVERVKAIADSRITVVEGSNIGFCASFFALIAMAPEDAKAYFLADQDDVWLDDKIGRAVSWLASVQTGTAALYCSRLKIVDESLNPRGLSPSGLGRSAFVRALSENIVVGCTAAFNSVARRLILKTGDQSKIYFHDWWIYLVVSAFGNVHFDPKPCVLYRQHDSNVLGMGSGIFRYLTMARFIARQDFVRIMFEQADNLLTAHGERLSHDQRAIIRNYFDRRSRRSMVRLACARRKLRRRWLDDLLLRALVFFAASSPLPNGDQHAIG